MNDFGHTGRVSKGCSILERRSNPRSRGTLSAATPSKAGLVPSLSDPSVSGGSKSAEKVVERKLQILGVRATSTDGKGALC